jgi:DNA ligase-1
MTHTGDVYACTCPAWRNQSLPVEQRTCKHLVTYLGVDREKVRLGAAFPERLAKLKTAKQPQGPQILLAENWDTATDITGWWMSEKLDGVRAWWNGKRFLSRQGNEFVAPDWFVEGFPAVPLDGELWMGRKVFQQTVSVVRRKTADKSWEAIQYRVFDAPAEQQPFEERMAFLQDQVVALGNDYLRFHEQSRCEGIEHLQTELARVDSLGGEGLMLREPASVYESGRSTTLLKVKNFHDAEAVVIEHQPGKGKHKGQLGALRVRLDDGTEFSLGSGFSEQDRNTPPPVGAVITYRYQELTDSGVPRFASFLRVRAEKDVKSNKQARAAAKQPAGASATDQGGSNMQRFIYEDEKTSKFWSITADDCEVTVHYGRTGTDGQTRKRKLATPEAAREHVETMIKEKTKKGYKAC